MVGSPEGEIQSKYSWYVIIYMYAYGYLSFAAANLRRCYFFYAVNDFLLCTRLLRNNANKLRRPEMYVYNHAKNWYFLVACELSWICKFLLINLKSQCFKHYFVQGRYNYIKSLMHCTDLALIISDSILCLSLGHVNFCGLCTGLN